MDQPNNAIHQRVKALFLEANELPAREQAAFVAKASKGDAEVQRRVLELLGASASDPAFLSEPTAGAAGEVKPKLTHDEAPTADSASRPGAIDEVPLGVEESPGALIGPYKLLQVIGEGGFGRVFMAEQEKPLRRRVALKIVKLGMDTRQVVARFDQERQALAIMDHPHIAKVLDGGATSTGRPYFVMELCTGEAITAYSDRQNLTLKQRIELFVQVCQAVQHAHQKGIIHRDLKPSNVLVSTQDGKPHAKVIDFGIAKATASRLTEKTLFTEHRQLIGTPEYMSPEQAEGSLDIDTRTDVYSLGVLLYELITGSTPFDSRSLRSAAFHEIQRIIREVDPPTPSTRVAQNTETIASVAARRLTEPGKLGTLIRGEIDWIIMRAMEKDRSRRYESPGDLAADLRRHLSGERVVAAPASRTYRLRKFIRKHRAGVLVSGLLAAVLCIGAVGTGFGFVQASRERDRARAALGDAEAVTEALSKVLLSAAPGEMGKDVTVRDIIDKASNGFGPEIEARPRVEARLRETMARAYMALGDYRASGRNIASAYDLSRRHEGEDAVMTLRIDLLRGRQMYYEGQYDAGKAHFDAALDRATKVLGDSHKVVVDGRNDLAALLLNQGKDKEAEPLIRDTLKAGNPSDVESRAAMIGRKGNLALTLSGQRKYEEADKLHREVIEEIEALVGAEHPATLTAKSNYALSLREQGKTADAVVIDEEVLRLRKKVLGNEHNETLTSENNLANGYRELGRNAEAEALYEHGLETSRRLQGNEHPETLIAMSNVAKFYMETSRLDKAITLFEECEAAHRKVMGDEFIGTMLTTLGHGICLNKMERYAEAESSLRDAYRMLKAAQGPRDSATRRASQELVVVYDKLGRKEDADKWREIVAKYKPAPKPGEGTAATPAVPSSEPAAEAAPAASSPPTSAPPTSTPPKSTPPTSAPPSSAPAPNSGPNP